MLMSTTNNLNINIGFCSFKNRNRINMASTDLNH